jgi:hypothetical protein
MELRGGVRSDMPEDDHGAEGSGPWSGRCLYERMNDMCSSMCPLGQALPANFPSGQNQPISQAC